MIFDTFLTRSVPGYTRKWPKYLWKNLKSQISRRRFDEVCLVVSDSKLNAEHDAHIHFAQKPREMP